MMLAPKRKSNGKKIFKGSKLKMTEKSRRPKEGWL
jgi:hypothetical protein